MSGPIVVLFDGSSAAERALYAATDIARRFHAAIHLVGIQAGIETQLDAAAVALTERLGAGRVFKTGFDHDVARSVGDYARHTRARMLVLGGSARQPDSLLARLADAVTRRAAVPVLFVRNGDAQQSQEEWRCQRILVPLDGSGLAEQIIPSVAALASRFEASVTLLRILPESAPAGGSRHTPLARAARQRRALAELEAMARLLRASGLSVNTRVLATPLSTAAAILQQAAELQSDLIALASRGYGVARQFGFGSVARDLVNDSDVGLFILVPRERAARADNLGATDLSLQTV